MLGTQQKRFLEDLETVFATHPWGLRKPASSLHVGHLRHLVVDRFRGNRCLLRVPMNGHLMGLLQFNKHL